MKEQSFQVKYIEGLSFNFSIIESVQNPGNYVITIPLCSEHLLYN